MLYKRIYSSIITAYKNQPGPSPLLFIFLDAVIIDFKIVNIV